MEREMLSAFIGLPQKVDVLVRDTERVQLGWARGVGWAGEENSTPVRRGLDRDSGRRF
jgi:hypothetical protein